LLRFDSERSRMAVFNVPICFVAPLAGTTDKQPERLQDISRDIVTVRTILQYLRQIERIKRAGIATSPDNIRFSKYILA
jgi:hypothetical protein